jgi:hypothetical protein
MKAFLPILGIFSWISGTFSSSSGSDDPQRRSDMILSRHAVAPAGQRSKIAFIPFVYPSCRSYGDVKFGVFAKPEHGDLFLAEDNEVLPPNFLHPPPDCDGKLTRGLKVEYLPSPGYTGGDRAMYYIDNQRGETWNYYQTIEVQ